MKYFFVLGKNPSLSIAEICAIFPEAQNGKIASSDIFILETDKLDAEQIIKRMGGIIKIGIIEKEGDKEEKQIIESIKIMAKPAGTGKFNFGISNYSKHKINIKKIGMEVKSWLRARDISCRWVISREPTLSSVVVEQNKMTSGGLEAALLPAENKLLIGRTLTVQPFKELSRRDYGRPARDDYSGMLPPKLAQIMINLALPFSTKGGMGNLYSSVKILDPFCGSGTIITEAMLMGYNNLTGGDISQKAIEDTKKNIEWIKTNYELQTLPNLPAFPAGRQVNNCELLNIDATKISQKINQNSIDAIITEPYLGPQRGERNFKNITRELEKLYSAILIEFKKILKPAGKIVMVWPIFLNAPLIKPAFPVGRQEEDKVILKDAGGLIFLNPSLNGLKIISPIPEKIKKNKNIKLTPRNTIVSGREGQKIWREIIILGE